MNRNSIKIVSSYVPTAKQVEAHCAIERLIGYGGAMGGGKTRWGCEMAKYLSLKFPGNFGLITRQSGNTLELTTMEVFFDEVIVPGSDEWKVLGCKFDKAKRVLYFTALNPPSKIAFSGLDSDNTEKIKSMNLGFFFIDEATEVAEAIFNMLITRLRRKIIPKIFRKGMVSANPEAGWVKRRFVDQKLPDHKFIFANYEDNPHLPDDYPELFATLPQRWRDKYLFGSWAAASGLVYKEFDKDFHVIKPFPIPSDALFIRGLDHGQQNPTACIGMALMLLNREELLQYIGERVEAVDPIFDHYPYAFVHKLYYSSGLIIDHKREIEQQWEGLKTKGCFVDPSTTRRDRQKMVIDSKGKPSYIEFSVFEEYADAPYPILDLVPANNDVAIGIDRISHLLRMGHLFFFDTEELEPLIGPGGEIRNYEWDTPRVEDDNFPDKPKKRNDHALDALRYAAMSLSQPQPKGKVIPFNSFDAVRKRAINWRKQQKNKGQYGVLKRGKLRLLGGQDGRHY